MTLLAIWGSIGYQILSAVDSEGSDLVVARVEPLPMEDKEENVDFNHVRDPFRYVVPKLRKDPVKSASVQIWVPPPLILTGIVTSGTKKVAVLESPDGATYFLSEGESINGVKMLTILERSVKYEYKKQTRDWALK